MSSRAIANNEHTRDDKQNDNNNMYKNISLVARVVSRHAVDRLSLPTKPSFIHAGDTAASNRPQTLGGSRSVHTFIRPGKKTVLGSMTVAGRSERSQNASASKGR